MKTLYLECNMGASGDMLMGALVDLMPDADAFLEKVNHLGIDGVEISREKKASCGVHGTHMVVKVHGEEEESLDVHIQEGHHHEHEHLHEEGHHHTGMSEIAEIVNNMPVSEKVKADVRAVYAIIADAESKVHGTTVEQIHFHEVGNKDAIADITAVCLAIEELAPDQIVASPVHVGHGEVRCAHGILPVPAPATAVILQGVPCYGGAIEGELCTPTGAALLKHFVSSYGAQPVMVTDRIGYGMGTKEFAAANMLRAWLGECEDESEQIIELNCNIDDCTGEQLGYAMELLMKAGALDAFFTPIQMKKNRPATMLSCICNPEDVGRLSQIILQNTTTLGVRSKACGRMKLNKEIKVISTEYGEVKIKISTGYGVRRIKPEFDDLIRLAEQNGVSVETIRGAVMKA